MHPVVTDQTCLSAFYHTVCVFPFGNQHFKGWWALQESLGSPQNAWDVGLVATAAVLLQRPEHRLCCQLGGNNNQGWAGCSSKLKGKPITPLPKKVINNLLSVKETGSPDHLAHWLSNSVAGRLEDVMRSQDRKSVV